MDIAFRAQVRLDEWRHKTMTDIVHIAGGLEPEKAGTLFIMMMGRIMKEYLSKNDEDLAFLKCIQEWIADNLAVNEAHNKKGG